MNRQRENIKEFIVLIRQLYKQNDVCHGRDLAELGKFLLHMMFDGKEITKAMDELETDAPNRYEKDPITDEWPYLNPYYVNKDKK